MSIFSYVDWPFKFLFGEVSVRVFCLFVNWAICHFIMNLEVFFIYPSYESFVTCMYIFIQALFISLNVPPDEQDILKLKVRFIDAFLLQLLLFFCIYYTRYIVINIALNSPFFSSVSTHLLFLAPAFSFVGSYFPLGATSCSLETCRSRSYSKGLPLRSPSASVRPSGIWLSFLKDIVIGYRIIGGQGF